MVKGSGLLSHVWWALIHCDGAIFRYMAAISDGHRHRRRVVMSRSKIVVILPVLSVSSRFGKMTGAR
jgi:hypothetical protein